MNGLTDEFKRVSQSFGANFEPGSKFEPTQSFGVKLESQQPRSEVASTLRTIPG